MKASQTDRLPNFANGRELRRQHPKRTPIVTPTDCTDCQRQGASKRPFVRMKNVVPTAGVVIILILLLQIITIHGSSNSFSISKKSVGMTYDDVINDPGDVSKEYNDNVVLEEQTPVKKRRRRRKRRVLDDTKNTDDVADAVIQDIIEFDPLNQTSIGIDDVGQTDDDDEEEDDDDIIVSCLTWNLAEIYPEDQTRHTEFLKELRGADLVCVCIQECENPKPRRTEGSRSKSIRSTLIQSFGKEYVPIALHSLGGLQLALFAHKAKMLHRLDYVSVADVACGVGNVFHNKGAIGAFVKTKADEKSGERRLMFVSSHLAAHASKVDDRNANYWRILAELESQVPPRFLLGNRKSIKSKSSSKLMDCLDYVFWGGDLNYRVDLPREYVEHTILNLQKTEEDNEMYDLLLRHDQLRHVISSGQAFNDFSEGM